MHGMFRANGGCGYVKKPELLMNDDLVFDPKSKQNVQKTLRVINILVLDLFYSGFSISFCHYEQIHVRFDR